jgi:hypothetical protein
MKYQIIEIRGTEKINCYNVITMLVRCLGGVFDNDICIISEAFTDEELSKLEIKEGRVFEKSISWDI